MSLLKSECNDEEICLDCGRRLPSSEICNYCEAWDDDNCQCGQCTGSDDDEE